MIIEIHENVWAVLSDKAKSDFLNKPYTKIRTFHQEYDYKTKRVTTVVREV